MSMSKSKKTTIGQDQPEMSPSKLYISNRVPHLMPLDLLHDYGVSQYLSSQHVEPTTTSVKSRPLVRLSLVNYLT